MAENISMILENYTNDLCKIYGNHLKKIILYGSYARGDNRKDSDIDIMILVDLQDEQMEALSDVLSELDFEYNVTYGIWIMPIVKNIQHFNSQNDIYPFYINVKKEGISLYEAA